jgi:AraC-like DNA-binding protein
LNPGSDAVNARTGNNGKVCPPPPAQIAPFVQILGVDLAALFLLRFGGAELALSENPREDSQLSALVGIDNARELGKLLRIPRRIPLAKPWLAGYLCAQGYSIAETARRLHVSDVSVRRYFKRAEERAARLASGGRS